MNVAKDFKMTPVYMRLLTLPLIILSGVLRGFIHPLEYIFDYRNWLYRRHVEKLTVGVLKGDLCMFVLPMDEVPEDILNPPPKEEEDSQ